jgi:hypothetical protein
VLRKLAMLLSASRRPQSKDRFRRYGNLQSHSSGSKRTCRIFQHGMCGFPFTSPELRATASKSPQMLSGSAETKQQGAMRFRSNGPGEPHLDNPNRTGGQPNPLLSSWFLNWHLDAESLLWLNFQRASPRFGGKKTKRTEKWTCPTAS